MAEKKDTNKLYREIANYTSIIIAVAMSAMFIIETYIMGITVDFGFSGLIIISAFIILIQMIRKTINYYKMAFNVPFILLLYNTALMLLCNWVLPHYLFICFVLSAISCLYSSFTRTAVYILAQNILIGLFLLKGDPIGGHGVSTYITLINWAICIFGSIIMLLVTRAATIILSKALEQQDSFRDLLDTTENYVAMINDKNEVVYASKTLSRLSNIEEPAFVQGRPLIDLFPGRSLKIYAGRLLRDKNNYAEDWEFSLQGQKRYFKAISHSILRGGGGSLISLYDMTHLAERDEIAAMKDSMKIGLFFMDKDYVIQDHYSRYLEEMLSEENLFGKLFTDIISDSVSENELGAIKDYFNMVLERSLDQEMLDEINPLNELHYVNARTHEKKVFQCAFSTVERDRGEVFILVTVYDITIRVELQQRLAEEEARRQEEMQALFELMQVEPSVFNDFMEDMEYEFDAIDGILKDEAMSTHEVLVKVYQSVHAVKSNAVILGLNVFGGKVHNLESKIKKLREMKEDVPFIELLNMAMDIEKISQEREGFKEIISKLQTYAGGESGSGGKQNIKVLVESLSKAISRAAEDMEKKAKFIADEIDHEAIDRGPRRTIKEILLQLVRNSIVHGIETPDIRKTKGKNETGIVKLSIKVTEDHQHIHIKLNDDGKGLDYKKISERALANKLIKKEDADNKDMLMKVIFAPGFSTAATEGMHGGRGIGLNLVRDRIKEVNGTIKLRSETDKGTVFFVSIPLAKKHPHEQQQKGKAAAGKAVGKTMQVTLEQTENILSSDITFSKLNFNMLITRLKMRYEKNPTSLQDYMDEINEFLEKFGDTMAKDYAIIEKL